MNEYISNQDLSEICGDSHIHTYYLPDNNAKERYKHLWEEIVKLYKEAKHNE